MENGTTPSQSQGNQSTTLPVMELLLSFVGIGHPCAPQKNFATIVPPPALRCSIRSNHQRRKLRVRFDESTKPSKDSPRNRGLSPEVAEKLFKVTGHVERQIALAKRRASEAASEGSRVESTWRA